ncbi:MAG: hypothetical protein AAB434_06300 [Planctomycetota bacterium]
MRCGNRAGRRGFAIFISIGVLALLSVLASSFAIMSQMERSVANSYVDKVRAKLLATSGIEMAVSELGRQAKSQAWESRYQRWGYDQEDNLPPHDDHRYNDLIPSARPSFVPASIPAGMPVCSGWLSATYGDGADYYKLKVVDTASQVDLNGPQSNLATILQNLGQAIAELRGTNPVPAGMGAAIVTFRSGLNGGQFRSKDELLGVPGMTQALYDVLKDYVAVAGYRDPRCINPNPSANFPGNWPNAGQLVSRAPINLNTAPYPVLVAWAAGLAGYAVRTSPTGPARLGTAPVQFVKTLVPAITYPEAQAIAHAIIERRQPSPQGADRPFKSMDDVAMWIDMPLPPGNPRNPYPNGLVQTGVISAEKGWVLMAMADPNLTTNKLFPTSPAYNPVDKQDLTYATSEVCFSSMGVYEVEALGRVLGPDSDGDIGGVNDRDVRAEVRVRTVARVYRVIRQTTQGDLTSISGFSTAMLDKVNSYPENIQDFPNQCPFEGMLALSSEWNTSPPGGTAVAWTRNRSQLVWDGGGGGMAAVPNAADPKDEGSSVFGGSDLHPDGLMTIRQAPEMLSYVTPTTLTDRNGAIDMWVKLSTPPTVGSDEPLLFLNVTGARTGGNGNNAQATGECVKLERFGTMLRCTRFYWGYPEPALSPYWHQYVEREALIDNWQADEWHHIAIQWREYDRPANDEWQEYDYWSEGRAYFWDGMSGGDEQTLYGAPDVNLRMFIDGTPATRLFTRFSQNRTYIVDNPPEATTLQRRVRLASKTPPPSWGQNNPTLPQGELNVGGYDFDRGGAAPVQIYRQGQLAGSYVQRYSNCTIDDLTVYSNDPFNGTGFSPPERFRVTGGAYMQHALDLRGMAPNAVVGTVRWNQRSPWAWRDRWLWPSPGTDQAPHVGCTWGVGNVLTSTGSVTPNACEGVAVGLPKGSADRLTYRLDFINAGGIFPLDVTPVVEDVTCTVVESPAFLSWESQ